MSPEQLAVWEQVALRVKDYPNGVGRQQIAYDFHVGKSTARVHLEKGVERGKLVKIFTWVDKRSRGWVYYHKTLMGERLDVKH